jgi:hypothetical protein
MADPTPYTLPIYRFAPVDDTLGFADAVTDKILGNTVHGFSLPFICWL